MDLKTVSADTQKIEIMHPGSGARTGLVFEVTSAEADAVKRVARRQTDKMLRTGRNKRPTAAELEANNAERVAAAIVGWEWKGDASWGGEKLPFSKENVASVLEESWVRTQIEEALADEAGFFLGTS